MRYIVFAMAVAVCFTAPSIAADLSGVSGVYLSRLNDSQFLTLRPDGTFFLRQKRTPPAKINPFIEFSGNYELNGETVILMLPNGGTAQGQLRGNIFTDSQGAVWVKRGTEQQKPVKPWYKVW